MRESESKLSRLTRPQPQDQGLIASCEPSCKHFHFSPDHTADGSGDICALDNSPVTFRQRCAHGLTFAQASRLPSQK
jgi:hypothetical protein